MRVHFHEMGLLEELRYRLQHPAALLIVLPNGTGQAHQRPAVRVRRSPAAIARRDLGELPARLAGPAGRAASSRISPPIRAGPRRCTNGSTLTGAPAAAAAGRTPARSGGALAAAVLQPGALPVLSVRGTAAVPARRRVGVRASAAGSTRRFSGAAWPASCSPSSASRPSTNTSTRAWAPTGCSTRPMRRRCPTAVLWLGVAAFAGALAVGVYLTVRGGWPILAFALLGGAAAIFYVAPPIRWAYRGLGEPSSRSRTGRGWCSAASICTRARFRGGALCASLVPGLLIMALAVVNAIPDFHQDRLVGKRNLVVRLGRRRAVRLYLALAGGADCSWCRSASPRACFRGRASRRCSLCRCSWSSARRAARTPLNAARSSCPRCAHIVALLPASRSRCSRRASWCMLALSASAGHYQHRAPRGAAASSRGSSRATATCAACTAAPSRRPESACPTSSTPTRRCGSRTRSSRNEVPYVMLCGGEPLVVPHFLAVADRLGRAGVQLKIETNGQRFDAAVVARLARLPIRSIQISLDGDTQEVYARQRARRLAREGARGLPRRARGGPAARGHLRAHAAQHPRGRGRDRACPRRSAHSASIPAR